MICYVGSCMPVFQEQEARCKQKWNEMHLASSLCTQYVRKMRISVKCKEKRGMRSEVKCGKEKAIIISRREKKKKKADEQAVRRKSNDQKKKKRKRNCMTFFSFFVFFSPSCFPRYSNPINVRLSVHAHIQPEMLVRKEKNVKKMVDNMRARPCRLPDWQKKTNVSENESPLSQAPRTFCIHHYMKNFMTRYTLEGSRCGSPKA